MTGTASEVKGRGGQLEEVKARAQQLVDALHAGLSRAAWRRALSHLATACGEDAELLGEDLLQLYLAASSYRQEEKAYWPLEEAPSSGAPGFWLAQYRLERPAREAFRQGLERYLEGEPLAYILGWSYFWDRSYRVGPGVLIPRPDTETLLRVLEEQLPDLQFRFRDSAAFNVLDACTGSGCLAISCQHILAGADLPAVHIDATDCSPIALTYARTNLGLEPGRGSLELWEADLWPPIRRRYALGLSNPPYIAPGDPELDQAVSGHEPSQALYAEEAGLAFYRRLLEEGRNYWEPGALLIWEHGARQKEALEALIGARQDYHLEASYQDFSGLDRAICLRYCRP